jgi:hypothetical protein
MARKLLTVQEAVVYSQWQVPRLHKLATLGWHSPHTDMLTLQWFFTRTVPGVRATLSALLVTQKLESQALLYTIDQAQLFTKTLT